MKPGRRRPPIPTTAEVALARLERALANRRDHAAFCGVIARYHYDQFGHGIAVEWRDAYSYERGLLALFPITADFQPTVWALLCALKEWKRAAALGQGIIAPGDTNVGLGACEANP